MQISFLLCAGFFTNEIGVVTQQSDATLELFGKGSPTIYINGRKISDSQELSMLLSGNIRNVEVIINPVASYSADAKSVIRIRTKKPQGDSWNGTFRSTNGFQHYYQSSNTAGLKYRIGGLEFFSNFMFNGGKKVNRYDNKCSFKMESETI